MRSSPALFALALGTLAGCSPAAAPCPATPASTPLASPSASASAPATPPFNPAGDADVALLLRPTAGDKPAVHVELALSATDPSWKAFRIASGSADHFVGPRARDASGDVPVVAADTAPGVTLTLARAPSGPLLLAYDVLAGNDAPTTRWAS
jgi:hypothetical protein